MLEKYTLQDLPLSRPAPDFQLAGLDGETHSLSQHRGRVVIINFWSAECPHSARVDGSLLRLVQEQPDHLRLLTIASNATETPAAIRLAALRRDLPLMLLDPNHQVADLYGAQTTPHLYVVDQEGILRYRGAFDDITFRRRQASRSYLEEAIRSLFAGKQPAPAETPPYGCTIIRFKMDSTFD